MGMLTLFEVLPQVADQQPVCGEGFSTELTAVIAMRVRQGPVLLQKMLTGEPSLTQKPNKLFSSLLFESGLSRLLLLPNIHKDTHRSWLKDGLLHFALPWYQNFDGFPGWIGFFAPTEKAFGLRLLFPANEAKGWPQQPEVGC